MSKSIISKESIMLGSGNVYFLDAGVGNYATSTSMTTKENLLSRMDNVRINIKKDLLITKQMVNGLVLDKDAHVKGYEIFLEFDYYEYNAKNLSSFLGGATTDVSTILNQFKSSPKKMRIEVEFKFPAGGKTLWYIFPKCISVSDLDFAPSNTEGATNRGSFRALPATDESVIWYQTSTYSFNSYIAD